MLAVMLAIAIAIGNTGTADIWNVATDGGPSAVVATSVEVVPPVEGVCLTVGLDWSDEARAPAASIAWKMDGAKVDFGDIPVARQFRWAVVGTFLQLNMVDKDAKHMSSWDQALTSVDIAGKSEVTVCR